MNFIDVINFILHNMCEELDYLKGRMKKKSFQRLNL
jgi:hypothetical protein